MVAFSHIAVALSAVAGALAAPAPVADLPDFELSSETSLVRRQDYNQNYKTSGNVNFSPTNNGYSVSFSNAGDFVVGKGWSTGTTRYAQLWPRRFMHSYANIGPIGTSTSAAPPAPPLEPCSSPSTVGPRTLWSSTTSRSTPATALVRLRAPRWVV
jgi:hypothetical protein